MRAISLNLNGWRSACRKGLLEWLGAQDADLVCLQEIKAGPQHEPAVPGYRVLWHPAERPGYSGVALLARAQPDAVACGLGDTAFDREGRLLCADFGLLTVLSVYVPSGSSSPERLEYKLAFLETFLVHLSQLLEKCRAQGRELLLCGDLNIAHHPIDLKNWRTNLRTSGFLPEERATFDRLLELGLVDATRKLLGPDTALYSWWSLRTRARARNVGWRLDYQLVTPGLAALALKTEIPREPVFSDHAPVVLEYGWAFDGTPKRASANTTVRATARITESAGCEA